MGLKRWNIAVVVAVGLIWCVGATQREKPVVGEPYASRAAQLEARLAEQPDDPTRLRELAQVYLDARAPGMALSLIEHAPELLRNEPTVEHTYARALLGQGRSTDALAVEQKLLAQCTGPTAAPPPPACTPHLIASATRYKNVLEQLVQLGVDDMTANPEAGNLAYINGTHQVGYSAE